MAMRTAMLAFALGLAAAPADAQDMVTIPAVASGPKHKVSLNDLMALRDIDTLSVSPDGATFVILVREPRPVHNGYVTRWFAGLTKGGALRPLADGGEMRLTMRANGTSGGGISGSAVRWSPDGNWIAYSVKRGGETQVWRSRIDSGETHQVSKGPSDVRDFAWSADGTRIFYTADAPRAELAAEREARGYGGYRLQEYPSLYNAVHSGVPPIPLSAKPGIFAARIDGSREGPASADEIAEFELARRREAAGGPERVTNIVSAVAPPTVSATGALAWFERVDPARKSLLPQIRLTASLSGKVEDRAQCQAAECTGQLFHGSWWDAAGGEVIFLRSVAPVYSAYAIYGWSPATGKLRTVYREEGVFLSGCTLTKGRFLCLRDQRLRPRHVVAFDLATGKEQVLADVNPETARWQLGRIERIEWDTPYDPGKHYSARAFGFVIYPPDYDPKRSYPVFLAPYDANGFVRGDVGNEHPLLAYAAQGMIVVNTRLPTAYNLFESCPDNFCIFREGYDPKRDYPHLKTLALSSFAALDEAARHANIDMTRVGSGGVSHGAFIPLHMLKLADRITALSVAETGWDVSEYYLEKISEPWEDPAKGSTSGRPKDPEFWKPIDPAQNLDQIEAPILFHFVDREFPGEFAAVRDIGDAGLPYDAYIFPGETHEKHQSAHRLAIYRRNLDWFKFWLMDAEDADPAKAEQYARWRKLRELQCKNPRSLRDFCKARSAAAP